MKHRNNLTIIMKWKALFSKTEELSLVCLAEEICTAGDFKPLPSCYSIPDLTVTPQYITFLEKPNHWPATKYFPSHMQPEGSLQCSSCKRSKVCWADT
jgi:hypothetical protein